MIYRNTRLVLEDRILENAYLETAGAKISAFGLMEELDGGKLAAAENSGEVTDLGGAFLAPGFVDIHNHGSGEHWFYDHPSEAAAWHLQEGTTSLLASLWRNAGEYSFEKAIENVRKAMEEPGSNIAGIHMEGPYLDPEYGCVGGKPWPIRKEEYERLLRIGGDLIRNWTFDPLQQGARDFAGAVHAAGIRLSVCYSKAKPELLEEYLPLGYSIGNHMLCGSGQGTPMFPGTREPGSDVFTLVRDEITAEVIADSLGGHVRPYYLKLIYKCKGPDRIALVSDCCAGGDTCGSDVNVIDGELYGSRLTLSVAIRNMRKHTGADVVSLCRMASLTPARAIGIDGRKGSIAVGKDADLVALDEDLFVKSVIKNGKKIR